MKILIVHNTYQQRGGEDTVVESESALLRERGHSVQLLMANNDHIQGKLSRLKTSLTSIYSVEGRRRVSQKIAEFAPDIVHIHNFFPTLSGSVFQACAHADVPVVHTLHNYRLVCAAATLFRDGHVCEECIERRSFLPGVEHACYRSSRLGSLVSGAGMAAHDMLGTWKDDVNGYIALNTFAAAKLGLFRLPPEKIYIKPNFTADFGMGNGAGGFALFAGRLTQEKGVPIILQADAEETLCMPVVLLGDGPLRGEVERAAARPGSRLIYKGAVDKQAMIRSMQEARVLILPSIWYEGGVPLVAIEAFSVGLPVLAANLPNLASLISNGVNGALFDPDTPGSLAVSLRHFAEPASLDSMRSSARADYLRLYTPEANYQALISIYEDVISKA